MPVSNATGPFSNATTPSSDSMAAVLYGGLAPLRYVDDDCAITEVRERYTPPPFLT